MNNDQAFISALVEMVPAPLPGLLPSREVRLDPLAPEPLALFVGGRQQKDDLKTTHRPPFVTAAIPAKVRGPDRWPDHGQTARRWCIRRAEDMTNCGIPRWCSGCRVL